MRQHACGAAGGSGRVSPEAGVRGDVGKSHYYGFWEGAVRAAFGKFSGPWGIGVVPGYLVPGPGVTRTGG